MNYYIIYNTVPHKLISQLQNGKFKYYDQVHSLKKLNPVFNVRYYLHETKDYILKSFGIEFGCISFNEKNKKLGNFAINFLSYNNIGNTEEKRGHTIEYSHSYEYLLDTLHNLLSDAGIVRNLNLKENRNIRFLLEQKISITIKRIDKFYDEITGTQINILHDVSYIDMISRHKYTILKKPILQFQFSDSKTFYYSTSLSTTISNGPRNVYLNYMVGFDSYDFWTEKYALYLKNALEQKY